MLCADRKPDFFWISARTAAKLNCWRAAEREAAIRAYKRLNSLGIEKLARGGILVAGSCSAHVSAVEFFDAIRHAAMKSGRKFTELKTLQHPPDHPAGFKEAEYLKVIYLKFAT